MRIPRDISGDQLARLLEKFNYMISRQTGSHLRLTTNQNGEHHITIPRHKNLKIGTLNSILSDIAQHLEIDKNQLIEELFAG